MKINKLFLRFLFIPIAFLQIQLILLGGDAFELTELLDKLTDIVETNLGGDFCNGLVSFQ